MRIRRTLSVLISLFILFSCFGVLRADGDNIAQPVTATYFPDNTYALNTVIECNCPSTLSNDGRPKILIFGNLGGCSHCRYMFSFLQRLKERCSDGFDIYYFQDREADASALMQDFTFRNGEYVIYNGSSYDSYLGALYRLLNDTRTDAGLPYQTLPLTGYFDASGKLVRVSTSSVSGAGLEAAVRAMGVTVPQASLADYVEKVVWHYDDPDDPRYHDTSYIYMLYYLYDYAPDGIEDGVYYTVKYNGNVIYTSNPDQTQCFYYDNYVPGTQYMRAGTYTVTFYDGNGAAFITRSVNVTCSVNESSGGSGSSGSGSSSGGSSSGGSGSSSQCDDPSCSTSGGSSAGSSSGNTFDLETRIGSCPSQLQFDDGMPKVIVFGDLVSCGNCEADFRILRQIKADYTDDEFDVYYFQIRNYDVSQLTEYIAANYNFGFEDYLIYTGTDSISAYSSLFSVCSDAARQSGAMSGSSFTLPLVTYVDGSGTIGASSTGYCSIDEVCASLRSIGITITPPSSGGSGSGSSGSTSSMYVAWWNGRYTSENEFTDVSVIDLDLRGSVPDITSVYYTVEYNGNLIYTSDTGLWEGYYRTTYEGAPVTNGYLSPGSYRITFLRTDGTVLGSDTATVRVSSSSNPTSSPTSAPTSAPTAAPTAAPTTAPSSGGGSSATGVNGFVERLYTIALGRNSDPAGQQSWVDTITSGQNTGADVARGFLFSSEFLNKNMSNEAFVTVLYRTFFNREPDSAGLNAWVGALERGESKQNIIEGFINSNEWTNVCISYGIPSGGTGTATVDVEPNRATIDFATRLYTTCLNRSADQAGLMAWARQLANQRDTGTGAARGFFFSSEFLNQNVSNGEYVTRLYRTFMGREPDSAGYSAWVGQLDSGVSREEVFNGFSQSQEFTAICAQYGIIRG